MWNKSIGRSTNDVIYCSCFCILRNVLHKETGDKWSPPQTITRDLQEPSHSPLQQKAFSVTECLNAHYSGTTLGVNPISVPVLENRSTVFVYIWEFWKQSIKKNTYISWIIVFNVFVLKIHYEARHYSNNVCCFATIYYICYNNNEIPMTPQRSMTFYLLSYMQWVST